MKILIIAQDFRISGTSEGIVSRSFIAKLRTAFSNAIIDVHYFKNYERNDQIELLPINSCKEYVISYKIGRVARLINKIYWRLFNQTISQKIILNRFKSKIQSIDYASYDAIFIRSSGLDYETILACKDLPILKKAIVNFHDPYPIFYDTSSANTLSKIDLNNYYMMYNVVQQSFRCISPSALLSKDLQFLYGSAKKFYTLPHQYATTVFDLTDKKEVRHKQKPISISYHGGLHYNRNLDILLDAFSAIVQENEFIRENVEMVFRLKSSQNKRLSEKYQHIKTIHILDGLNFSNSAYEQEHETDIIILLESTTHYSNILVGKAPFAASLNKPVLALVPQECELTNIITDNKYLAKNDEIGDIKEKLIYLINNINNDRVSKPFGDYFSDENFEKNINRILSK